MTFTFTLPKEFKVPADFKQVLPKLEPMDVVIAKLKEMHEKLLQGNSSS